MTSKVIVSIATMPLEYPFMSQPKKLRVHRSFHFKENIIIATGATSEELLEFTTLSGDVFRAFEICGWVRR